MTTETMTIHKALCELKVLDDRIATAILEASFVKANKATNKLINGKPISAFNDKAKSDYQKITDLINRRNAIKRAVVLSNATTTITINNVVYTIAEAIEMKNHGMEAKNQLYRSLVTEHKRAMIEYNRYSGDALDTKADAYVMGIIQCQSKDSKMSMESEGISALRKQYIADNAYELIDPLHAMEIANALRDEVQGFKTEIDSALSTSNALTTITIEY